ncbi:Rz1-like protein [Rahnella phage Sarma103]|nr:Rz1-like protein [Rahnella phage Sarma103]
MSTSRMLRHARVNALLSKVQSTKSRKTTKTSWLNLKGALIGLLLICTAMVSGCGLNSKPLVEPQKVSIDASLMVKPNLTMETLNVLSQ